jgi:hypothetical protein
MADMYDILNTECPFLTPDCLRSVENRRDGVKWISTAGFPVPGYTWSDSQGDGRWYPPTQNLREKRTRVRLLHHPGRRRTSQSYNPITYYYCSKSRQCNGILQSQRACSSTVDSYFIVAMLRLDLIIVPTSSFRNE